jgi:hypothetical protein
MLQIINSAGQEVPSKTLVIIPHPGKDKNKILELLEPLKGKVKREWFPPYFYNCLPLNIGNQYGFIVKAAKDFSVIWNGGENNSDMTVTMEQDANPTQLVASHFGHGILTIQNAWRYATSPGVNLMTISPPNYIKDGTTHLTGVVETDNLRQDFTFNIRINEPNTLITYKAGEPVGAFIPIPRYYADNFEIAFAEDIYTQEQISAEHDTLNEFSRIRSTVDIVNVGGVGRRYFKGIDAWGNKFPDHQRK